MMRGKVVCMVLAACLVASLAWAGSYPIVDTGQNACFNNSRQIECPGPGASFNGQDAQYKGNKLRYLDNGDGTVTDLVTGLMWVKARGRQMSWYDAMDGAGECRVGGYTDWRPPTIKELYSLIDFNGWGQPTEKGSTPFINTTYFDFAYGDTSKGERIIDCQDWSSTSYVHKTMDNNDTAFGVNFADGRIKGYGKGKIGRRTVTHYIRYVRGNPEYGKNDFVDNRDGTVTDKATGLTWQQADNSKGMNWENALSYCENLDFAGKTDWRLPSAKELQSIVDYTRSPKTSNSPAINPIFHNTDIEAWYWSSTTHLDGPKPSHAVYLAFGRAMGYFAPPGSSQKRELDVHGAGAQRSDPKSGSPRKGFGPQGDEQRVYNYARCVRGGGVEYYEPPYKRIPAWQGGHGNPNMQMGSGQRSNQDFNMPQEMEQGMRQGPGMGQGGGMQEGMNNGGGMRRGGPPPEAFEACDGASEGDSCTVETPRGTLNGMCRNMPEGKVCVPGRR